MCACVYFCTCVQESSSFRPGEQEHLFHEFTDFILQLGDRAVTHTWLSGVVITDRLVSTTSMNSSCLGTHRYTDPTTHTYAWFCMCILIFWSNLRPICKVQSTCWKIPIEHKREPRHSVSTKCTKVIFTLTFHFALTSCFLHYYSASKIGIKKGPVLHNYIVWGWALYFFFFLSQRYKWFSAAAFFQNNTQTSHKYCALSRAH